MSAPEPSPQSGLKGGILAGRFTIERSLGAGGMGEVYLAMDTKLHRKVAVKRVAARWRDDDQHRRQLMREAERCSSLSHPNIAAIYDVLQDDASGELAIVMEYVDGVTLRLSIGQPADRETFFRVALPCSEAVAAAHQQGIVHGDLKPENIMLARNTARQRPTFASAQPEVYADSGIVKVLDFGLATCLNSSPDEQTETRDLFTPGSHGTLGYVAPEVLRGQPPTPASDVFALGIIFYELLTGKHPFVGATSAVTLDRTLHFDPKLTAEQAGSTEVAQIVNKMLAKDVNARYFNAKEVLRDLQQAFGSSDKAPTRKLRWLGYAALALTVCAGIGIALRYRGHRSAISQYKLIAVMPFRPISSPPRPELEALSEGMAETATAKLTHLSGAEGLQIVAASDMSKIHSDVDAARRELGVDLAITGSMQQSGNRIRINFGLVDTATHRELRADSVDADASDVFQLEDSTVAGIVNLLDVAMHAGDREQISEHGTQSAVAYQKYLEGTGYLRDYEDVKNVDASIAAFDAAQAADRNYGLAYAGLGRAYWYKYQATRDASLVDNAREMCATAARLAPTLSPPHVCLGTLANGTGQYEDAVREFTLATSLDKSDDDAVRGLAFAQQKLNRLTEAEATFKRAIELRPQYWAGYTWLAVFYRKQARYRDAARQYELAAEHSPQNASIFAYLGGVYIYLGDYQKAEAALQRSVQLNRQYKAYWNLGMAYFRERRFDEAIKTLETAEQLAPNDYHTAGNLADVYYWTPGKRDLSGTYYRKAIDLAVQALQVNPNDYEAHVLIAHYYARVGNRAAALEHMQTGLAAQKQDEEVFYYAALVANELGEGTQAISWLRAALAHGYSPAEIRSDIELDNLRSNPEFQKLITSN